ncbi:RICIN domain-containing protein [Streptomyces sp. NPDC047022]|uniref:RICIN domain-containing protein n=1 Tax=Streptomyces sp. NPDC047022 TaxID=3155737 RepID=UPI0033D89983
MGVASGSGPGAMGTADPSDTRLTELLRADTATSYQALQDLRARHRPSVLAYARLCTTSEPAARQLAGQTFTLAARQTAHGTDPGLPWRHRLLLLTARLAMSWARDERAAGLDPGLLLVMNTAGPHGPVPPMLAAYQSLPSRIQGLLWYGVVEHEPEEGTATFLGLRREDVVYGTEQALTAMSQSCLRSRLAVSDDPHCGDFRRLIEESVRPDNPRHSADMHAHMAHCGHCTAAYEELIALRDTPRTVLAEGLLPWGGTAYAMDSASEHPSNAPATGTTWPPRRRFALATVALGLALAPLLVFMLSSGGPREQRAASSSVSPPAAPPAVTVTATVSVSPTASPSPSPTPTPSAKSPSPTRSSQPPKPTPTPTAHAPDGTYAQVVNASTGRCLDVDGYFDDGTDVVTEPCRSSPTQLWRVDTSRGVLQSYADADFCLDSRGSVDRGVGIWGCDSVYGRNGDNLRFSVDADGAIRPAIALDTALTPDGRHGLSLQPLSGGPEQRWLAGAS